MTMMRVLTSPLPLEPAWSYSDALSLLKDMFVIWVNWLGKKERGLELNLTVEVRTLYFLGERREAGMQSGPYCTGGSPEHGVKIKLFSSCSIFAVGKNDGSVEGQRYFQTDSQRGIFVREGDLVVLASPLSQ